jgi:ribonuclease BN (tRNA processing enzyme)
MDGHFLGTNGWYDTETGNTICTLIRTDRWEILLDAGYGIARADRHLTADPDNPTFLLLSHFHLDHVAGLHTLAKFRFPKGLIIAGPQGSREKPGRTRQRTLHEVPGGAPLPGGCSGTSG